MFGWREVFLGLALVGASGCAMARVERPVRRAALPVAALKDEPVRIAVTGPGMAAHAGRVTVERLHLDATALAWVRPDGTSVELPYAAMERVEVSSPMLGYAVLGSLVGAILGSGISGGIGFVVGTELGPDGGMLGGLGGIMSAAVGGALFAIVGGVVGAATAPIDVDVQVRDVASLGPTAAASGP
jgi:hypothetical protein